MRVIHCIMLATFRVLRFPNGVQKKFLGFFFNFGFRSSVVKPVFAIVPGCSNSRRVEQCCDSWILAEILIRLFQTSQIVSINQISREKEPVWLPCVNCIEYIGGFLRSEARTKANLDCRLMTV